MMLWHLFIVSDGTRRRLVSANSGSPLKSEELVTSAMVVEREFDPQHTGAEFVGTLDRDVDLEL
jgi:hypothetical protein